MRKVSVDRTRWDWYKNSAVPCLPVVYLGFRDPLDVARYWLGFVETCVRILLDVWCEPGLVMQGSGISIVLEIRYDVYLSIVR